MKTLELFSGTKSFSKVASSLGHSTYTVDNNDSLEPDECIDIRIWKPIYEIDVLWASPPCQGFSVASIGRNWNYDNTPKTDSARLGIELVNRTIDLINIIKPTWFFIENPRGKLRKLCLLDNFIRHTITYCQYGDNRMKATDIWTNAYWWNPRPICNNGDLCHVRAPRGSRTGTQGMNNAKEKGRIPEQLFLEIFKQLDEKTKEKGQ